MNERSAERLIPGILAGDRLALARGITLVESEREDHREAAERVLEALLPHTGKALRIGISGVPGVGKSTFVESFGLHLVDALGLPVAVLAVDPSSTLSGGSLLGDKSRMHRLSQHPQAFVRPSPNATHLGGVARRTREASLLLEAAGFQAVLIETVGVGQAEVAVAGMVDFYLVLLLAGVGDELQGIKRGILELADGVCINKADGDQIEAASAAARQVASALATLRPGEKPAPYVAAISARTGSGVPELAAQIQGRVARLAESGALEAKRRQQRRRWLKEALETALLRRLQHSALLAQRLPELEAAVEAGRSSPEHAARELIAGLIADLDRRPG